MSFLTEPKLDVVQKSVQLFLSSLAAGHDQRHINHPNNFPNLIASLDLGKSLYERRIDV